MGVGNVNRGVHRRTHLSLPRDPKAERALNESIYLKEDKPTQARAQAEISLHSSPSSATYRVKILAPKENPRPSSGARG